VLLIPVVHIDLRISPRTLKKKNRNDPNVIFRGLGEDEAWEKMRLEKPEAKNLVKLYL
jgi:hypothetical protein